MQHPILDLLGAALVPELGADITAGAAGNIQLVLVTVAALGALPHQLAVVLHDLDLAVVTAALAVIGLGVQLGVHDVVVDELQYAHDGFQIILHVGHFHIADGAARRELLEFTLKFQLGKGVDLPFTILVYLSIGPCLAIPRTASTSFQMLVPLIGGGTGLQLAYSVLFFAAAFLVALRPEKLTDWLGRILCPCLIVLIVVLFAGCLIHPLAAHYGTPSAEYAALPAVQGILYGYQTMDTLAGLNFGAVIALNIRARGVTESRAVEGGTIRAGFIAGGLLLVVYAMLGHAGAETGTVYPGLATGAEVLTALAQTLFGRAGLVLIAAIFVIACFNTCVGLIACVGQYFHQLLPRIPYPAIAAFFAVASMLVSNLGLAAIIRLSTPVLNAIYPAAIVLILLSFMPGLEKHRAVYPLCMGLTALQSIAAALPLGAVSAAANALPLGSMGFGWVLPALAGLAAGLLLNKSDLQ